MATQLSPRVLPPLLLSLLLLAGCSPGGDRPSQAVEAVPQAERFGGTAVVAGIVDLQSMNALTSNEGDSHQVQRDVLFLTLFRHDEKLDPQPYLAERWDSVRVRPDTLELTFHLRRDVAWHDGTPTTARDVAFTFARVRDPDVASAMASSFALYGERVEIVDDHTLRVRLRPHADFLEGWAALPIMPHHILGQVPPAQLAQHPFGTSEPVGNGPFRFVRRVPGQEWVFEANPDFPEALGGRPYLDRLVFRAIPEQTTLLTELITGRVDVYLGVPAAQAPQLDRAANLRVISSATRDWTFIGWNGRLPFFDAPEERRALTMAIDRQAIRNAILHPGTAVGRGPVTPAHWSFDPEEPSTQLPHDPGGARELLARAGWVDRDGDGILQDAEGRPFRFDLMVPQGNENARDIAQIAQAQLRQVGVDVRPRVVEGNTLIAQLMGHVNARAERERGFEAVVISWSDSFRKDDSNLFHSRNLNAPFQIPSFVNARADQLLDTLGVIVEREAAMPLWREYQALLAREAPLTVLYYPNRLTGVSRRMQGVETDIRGELTTVSRWFILPDQRGTRTSSPPQAP
jgi:peptide/nickel transport system substrate-binding protein